MKLLNFLTMVHFACLVSVTSIHADTMEIIALADATVESNGINGQEIVHDGEAIQTSMSGGSNIRDGLYEFDLSVIPSGASITSAVLQLRTAALISNTGTEAPIEFYAFTGNGTLELADQANSATFVAMASYPVGTLANVDLEIDLTNTIPLDNVLGDSNSDDFLTIRSETENFALYRVYSTEATDSDAVPPSLLVTYSGGLLLGDVNMDCTVNLLDVAPFVEAVSLGVYVAEADVNEDGLVNLLDVAPFVALLTGS